MSRKRSYNSVNAMMNNLNNEVKNAGGIEPYIKKLKTNRKNLQNSVIRLLAQRGNLPPAAARMLNTPMEVNNYIKAQNTNNKFVNAVTRVLKTKNKNKINRSNLARYLFITLKKVPVNKMFPYSGYYRNNGSLNNNKAKNWYESFNLYNSQIEDPPMNSRGEYGNNYTNFIKFKNKTNYMSYTKNELIQLAMAYINYREGNLNLAQNKLRYSLRVR